MSTIRAILATLRRMPRGHHAVFGLFVIVATLYGGSKGRITFDTAYIRDAGSYYNTNTFDRVYISISKASALLPDSAQILVYYREQTSSNAADWVQFEPVLTFADFPHEYLLENCTNFSVFVMANFSPAPTVHTNGVWQMRGFMIPGITNWAFKAAFPNARHKEVE